uniref:Uncharacterized protein n=1 Tax=Sphaerodactylus townsendi TaxID=933632 RepID=A0ACB8FXM4_9SAUR
MDNSYSNEESWTRKSGKAGSALFILAQRVLHNETIERARESLEGGTTLLPSEATAVPFPESEEDRPREPVLDSAEGCQMKHNPRLRLSTQLSTEKKSSLEDISPADSGVGVSPFLATRNNSLGNGKDPEGCSVFFAKPSGKDPNDLTYLAGVDVPDIPDAGSPSIQPTAQEKTSPSSKIPVKTKRLSLKSSKLPSLEWDDGLLKLSGNYTISSLSNKGEEISLDREHFKNLKNFWEKGGESALTKDTPQKPSEKASVVEVNGRPPRLRRSTSVQSNQSQNSDEKPGSHIYSKARILPKRTATLSSSEDEPVYIAPPRKGSGSCIPRSTYGGSKGSVHKNNSNDGNGKQHSVEEEKKAPRCPRRSKLPVRVPSLKIESPTKEPSGIIFEPETPADEYVMADESRRKADSLVGRVKILIESASLEDLDKVTLENNPDTRNHLETNEEPRGNKPCAPASDPLQNEAADEREVIQEQDYSALSGTRLLAC